MKATVHTCLESMLYEALTVVNATVEAYKTAQVDFFKNRNDQASITLWQAKDAMDAALSRMSNLETAKRIIDEMEKKGVEL